MIKSHFFLAGVTRRPRQSDTKVALHGLAFGFLLCVARHKPNYLFPSYFVGFYWLFVQQKKSLKPERNKSVCGWQLPEDPKSIPPEKVLKTLQLFSELNEPLFISDLLPAKLIFVARKSLRNRKPIFNWISLLRSCLLPQHFKLVEDHSILTTGEHTIFEAEHTFFTSLGRWIPSALQGGEKF